MLLKYGAVERLQVSPIKSDILFQMSELLGHIFVGYFFRFIVAMLIFLDSKYLKGTV